MSLDGDIVPVDPSEVLTAKRNSSQSWILIDATGQYTVLDLDKYAIMRRVQIHARDLRILDPNISSPSSIRSRERAIVLNLEVETFSFLCSFFGHYVFFFFFRLLIIFVLFCGPMKHIKAIITAEEVSLFSTFSLLVPFPSGCLLGSYFHFERKV